MATHVKTRTRVWHDDGTVGDLTDRVISGPGRSISIDAADFTCGMNFDNSPVWITGNLSLDPLDELSTLNLDGSGDLDPLLSENHEIQVDYDLGAGWVPFFQGYAGSDVGSTVVSSKRHTVTFNPIGITGPLRQKNRLQEFTYTDRDLATSLLQSILLQSGFLGKLSHVVILDDPLLQVDSFTTKQASTWQALQDAIAVTGYVLMARYHASGFAYGDGSGESTPNAGYYLTLYDPVRDKTVPDHIWTSECVQRKVKYSIDDVRTWIQVAYTLTNGAQKYTTPTQDEAARAKYGIPAGDGTKLHHQMRLVEGSNSPIHDEASANTYQSFALHDLSTPSPNTAIDIDEFYADPELHDLIEFEFQDYTVQIGVTSIDVDLSPDNPRGSTTISGAIGKVIGLRNYWLGRGDQTEEEAAARRLQWLAGGEGKLSAPTILSVRKYTYQDVEGKTHGAISLHWTRALEWWFGNTGVYVSIEDKGHYGTEPLLTTRLSYCTIQPLPVGVDVYVKLRSFPSPNMSPQGNR